MVGSKEILRTKVGSHLHGTETTESDLDIRGIYITPTSQILSIHNYQKYKDNKSEDEFFWEVQHFIHQAMKGNPMLLEVLISASRHGTVRSEGVDLLKLFPFLLSRNAVFNSFRGFSESQRQKYTSSTTNYFRKPKAASHMIRSLYNGVELLKTGWFTARIIDTPIGESVVKAKKGELLFEEVLEIADKLFAELQAAYEKSKLPYSPDYDRIDEYLLKIRKENW